ncbi:MAG: signal peptidase I [Flavobacterium sp.]|nr:signal peptidase I [Flavobacterium sp.]
MSDVNNDSESSKELNKHTFSDWFRVLKDLVLITALFILFIVFIAQPVVVDGTSMLPNLKKSERLLVNKLTYYKYSELQRGDIIVFSTTHNPELTYIKRIVGLPGESIELKNGVDFINGKKLNEPYLDQQYNSSLPTESQKTIDDFHYFVMGDNRDYSSDSRYWGAIPEKLIQGKVVFRFWQPSSIGLISNGNSTISEE